MAIYDKPTWQLMWVMVEKFSLSKGEIISKSRVIDWFGKNHPKIKQSTVSAHLIKMSTNAPSRVHYNAKRKSDDLFYQINGSHFRLYDESVDPLPIYGDSKKSSPTRSEASRYQLQEAEYQLNLLSELKPLR